MTDSRLKALLDQVQTHGEPLPFVHMTDCFGLVGIAKDRRLAVTHCRVMNEDLVYMFYGKPAYRTKHNGNMGLSANLPCAFIFDPKSLSANIKRIYPFDSGGFATGLYQNYFHRKSELYSFELPGDLEYAEKIIQHFFVGKRDYYHGKSRKNVDVQPLDFVVEGLVEMARSPSYPSAEHSLSPDERASAIEIQLDTDVPIGKSVMAVVLPQIVLESGEITQMLDGLTDTRKIFYEVGNFADSRAIATLIYDKVASYYEQLKQFG
jgi:hypothetical protein